AALVVTAFGFTCLVGAPGRAGAIDTRFHDELRQMLLAPSDQLPGYLLWYAPPPAWRAWLDARPEGSFRSRERVRLRWDAGEPSYLGQSETSETALQGLRLAPL